MGEAKRRKLAGEMDLWFHGTNEHFETWDQPPVISKYKEELFPHQFISFTKDRTLANGAGEIANGLCSIKLFPHAKVLDLRKESIDTRRHYEIVKKNEIAKKHLLLADYKLWRKGCSSGEILRMLTIDQQLGQYYENMIRKSSSRRIPIQEAQAAHVEVQNFTRSWIESVISPAKSLGYDAVICCEIDRYRKGGPKPCVNLHVFNVDKISKPQWINKPDENLMTKYMEEIGKLGIR